MSFESLGTVYHAILRFRVTAIPSPGAKKLTALHKLRRKGGAQACSGSRSVLKLVVPAPKNSRLFRARKTRVLPQTTHIGSRVLQVVISGNGHVKVDLASLAAVAPRRATVFLHDEGSPVALQGAGDTDKDALAAPHAHVCTPTAGIIFTEKRTEAVTGRTNKPHSFPIHSTTVVVWVLRAVSWARDVFGVVPRLQSARIARHSVAVPEVCEFDASGPVPRRSRRQFCGGRLRRGCLCRGGKQLRHGDSRSGWPASPETRPVQVAPSSLVVKVEHAFFILITVRLARRLGARIPAQTQTLNALIIFASLWSQIHVFVLVSYNGRRGRGIISRCLHGWRSSRWR